MLNKKPAYIYVYRNLKIILWLYFKLIFG